MFTTIKLKTADLNDPQFLKYCFRILFLCFAVSTWSCSNDNEDVYHDIPLVFKKPSNFPEPYYNYTVNPPTKAGFELGKKLFYDGRLASDDVVSCGFCHLQSYAFTHHGHSLSHGVNNAIGMRNAPPLQNLAYQSAFMWDGAADHLDLQPVIPLTSELEMNSTFPMVIAMMQNDAEYRKMFKRAFHNGIINSENMLKALGQFMVTLTSSDSKFDKYRRNEPGGDLNQQELSGYAIFGQKCASCHATDIFTDNSFRNNGLAVNTQLNDEGRFRVTLLDQDKYKYKVPSLRNVEVTAPYMHDGRFYTLDAVLNHYSSGVQDSPTIDPVLHQNGTLGIALNADEKLALIAFLKTLTDEDFLNNPKYSEY